MASTIDWVQSALFQRKCGQCKSACIGKWGQQRAAYLPSQTKAQPSEAHDLRQQACCERPSHHSVLSATIICCYASSPLAWQRCFICLSMPEEAVQRDRSRQQPPWAPSVGRCHPAGCILTQHAPERLQICQL